MRLYGLESEMSERRKILGFLAFASVGGFYTRERYIFILGVNFIFQPMAAHSFPSKAKAKAKAKAILSNR